MMPGLVRAEVGREGGRIELRSFVISLADHVLSLETEAGRLCSRHKLLDCFIVVVGQWESELLDQGSRVEADGDRVKETLRCGCVGCSISGIRDD